MIDPGLTGRVVLVTGANNAFGVGAATARAFARQGALVFLTYLRAANYPAGPDAKADEPGRAFYSRQHMAPIEPVLDLIRSEGGRAEAWEADLADARVIPALFDRAEAVLGPIELLINNAAHCVSDTFMPPAVLRMAPLSSTGTSTLPLNRDTIRRRGGRGSGRDSR